MGRAVAGAVLLVVLALSACDDEDGEPSSISVATIEVEAAEPADERIAADFVRYVNRSCRESSTFERFSQQIEEAVEPEPAVIRAYLVDRYGSIRRAFEAGARGCEAIRRVQVENGVITLETDLGAEPLDDVLAEDTCDLIQASDVADFAEGHRILGADGQALATCAARSG